MSGRKGSNRNSSEEVIDVHYSKYCRDTLVDNSEVIKDAVKHCENKDIDREFIDHVYNEPNGT